MENVTALQLHPTLLVMGGQLVVTLLILPKILSWILSVNLVMTHLATLQECVRKTASGVDPSHTVVSIRSEESLKYL